MPSTPLYRQHPSSQKQPMLSTYSGTFCLLCHDYSVLPLTIIISEKAMAPHSSTLTWKIPWMEEPGRLQSMGLLKVRHNWVTSLLLFAFMHWRRKWQPTPVFLPEESQGRGSLVGCRLWGHTESDTAEATQQQQYNYFSSQILSNYEVRDEDLSLYYLECLPEVNVPMFMKKQISKERKHTKIQ